MGCMYFGLMVSCRKFRQYKDWYTRIARGNESLEKTTKAKIAIGTLISFRSLDKWVLKADRWNSRCKNHESKYVAVPTGRKNFFGEIYERSGFCNLIDRPFAGRIAQIPKDFQTYMKALYGNYMEIPPVEKRERHIFYPPMKLR
jgi:lipopolysaccharide cholinephosphotransferase